MGLFDKKPGRPTNTAVFARGLAEGLVRGAVQSNGFANTVNSGVKSHTGKDFGDYAASGVKNISSRLK